MRILVLRLCYYSPVLKTTSPSMMVITLLMAVMSCGSTVEDVLIQDAQIGQLARLDRALDVFLAVLPGPPIVYIRMASSTVRRWSGL